MLIGNVQIKNKLSDESLHPFIMTTCHFIRTLQKCMSICVCVCVYVCGGGWVTHLLWTSLTNNSIITILCMEIPAILRDAVAQLFLILCDNTSAQWEGEWAFTDPLITHAIMNSLLNNDKEEKKGISKRQRPLQIWNSDLDRWNTCNVLQSAARTCSKKTTSCI